MLTITYNAQYCPKRHKAARAAHVAAFDTLAALVPEVIGVCEAGGYRRELANVTGYRAIQPKGSAGRCALLIRDDLTVHDSGAFRLHGRRFVGRDVPGARVTGWTKAREILWVVVSDDHDGLRRVVASWHPVPGQSHSARARKLLAEEAQKAAEWIKAQKYPVDLMGDTNGDPGLLLFKPLREVASPAFAVSRGKDRIDGHWIAGGTGQARPLDGYPSDHKPVAAVITWADARPAPTPKPVKENTMSGYRKADTKTQWFQDKYPGAVMTPNCVILHTTEGMSWPTYSGGSIAPNYTARPNFEKKRLDWRQHFPDERSSRALENHPGGVETNTLNVVQVELIGTCDPTHAKTWAGRRAGRDYIYWPEAPAWALRGVADFLADQAKRHGTKLVAPKPFEAYPASYGANNGVRMTASEWVNFYGIAGHQHVPENDHGDPGALDINRIIGYATGAPAAKPVAKQAQETARRHAPAPVDRPYHEQQAINEARTVARNAKKAGHKHRASMWRSILDTMLGRKK
jgi:hypothetical protein